MKGDFTRVSYDATRHVRRVLTQQGRVELDSDSNEQTAALLHQVEAAMRDLVGPYAAPRPEASDGLDGFRVGPGAEFDVLIAPGHYWVDGILCENEAIDGVPFTEQPDYPVKAENQAGRHLLYLDVWERHLCADEAPWEREVALGGPDTSSRSKLVWQAKLVGELPGQFSAPSVRKNFPSLVGRLQPEHRGLLSARAKAPTGMADPCIMPPDSRYRGPENQLYRVEIHDAGLEETATFKWSRDNGSVVFPVRTAQGTEVRVERLSIDPRFTLKPGDWVELVDDAVTLRGETGRLLEVGGVDPDELVITVILPAGDDPLPGYDEEATTHPLLRRWDQRSAAVAIEEGTWLDLEDGVQVKFDPAAVDEADPGQHYRTGDYWQIPARVATGDVEWPDDAAGQPLAVRPHGIEHHYAPLALVTFDAAGAATVTDVRRRIAKMWEDL